MDVKTDDAGMIEKALSMALMAHAGQKDKYGAPYVLHPLRVGLGGESAAEIASGFLHDVIEDTPKTVDHLRGEGFPEEVLTIVDHLTKREGEGWEAYIHRVMEHEPSMRVKLRDLAHNMDATRIPEFGEKDADRFARYVWAWHEIRSTLGGNE